MTKKRDEKIKDIEDLLRQDHVHMQGRLLASFSHELNNHIAIINETSGLIQDYLDMGHLTQEESKAKLLPLLQSILGRTEQMASMANHLNRYAHRFDTPLSNFNVNDLVLEQIFLLNRLARLNTISLTTNLSSDDLSAYGSPGLISLLIHHFVIIGINTFIKQEELLVTTMKKKQDVIISFSPSPISSFKEPAEISKPSPVITHCLSKCGGSLHFVSPDKDKNPTIIGFSFPLMLKQ